MNQTKLTKIIGIFTILLLSLTCLVAAEDEAKGYKSLLSTVDNVQVNDYVTNLFTGSATYSYPLEVIPGRNGLEPQLLLYYNHNKKNVMSEVGNGWGITSTYIVRDTKGTISDTSDDEFTLSLNGVSSKLVYVASERRYHTEHESYLKIENSKGVDNDSNCWSVRSKDGVKYEIGCYSDSRIINTQTNKIMKWYINRVTDPYNNYISYSYHKIGDDTVLYPNFIFYNQGSNMIYFYYKNGNTRDYYSDGIRVKRSKVIDKITMSKNNNIVRSYKFDYITKDSMRLLSSITEQDKSGNSLPKTIFEYNDPYKGFDSKQEFLVPEEAVFGKTTSNGVRLVDVNGDGRVDIVKMKDSADMDYWLNDGTKFTQKKTFSNVLPGGFVDNEGIDNGVRFVDINGDTKIDIIQLINGKKSARKVVINNGNGFSESDMLNKIPSEVNFVTVEDVTYQNTQKLCDPCEISCNTGKVEDLDCDPNTEKCKWDCVYYKCYKNGDYMGYKYNSRSTCLRSSRCEECPKKINDESCTMSCTTVITPYTVTDYKDNGFIFVDVNGDKEVDIVKGIASDKKTWINKGDSWELDDNWKLPAEADLITSDHKPGGSKFMDVNGDGLIDVVKAKDTQKKLWLNTGSGWIEDTTWSIPSGMYFVYGGKDYGSVIVDIDGDGLNDITRGTYGTYRNTGNGWIWDSNWRMPSYSVLTDHSTTLADVNGDGALDVLIAPDSSKIYTYMNKATKANLMSRITTKFGGKTTIDYKKIPSLDNTGDDDVSDLGLSGWVVNSMSYDNGMGKINSYSYDYSGGLFDSEDKEFVGFNYVEEIRPDGSKIKHFFYQDKAKQGLEYKTELADNQNKLFGKVENEYSSSKQDGYYIITLKSAKNHDYDGLSDARIIQTDFEYDQYGNIVKTSYLGDVSKTGDERYEYNEYKYNTYYWIVNTPKTSYLLDSDDSTKIMQVDYTYNPGGDIIKEEFWNSEGDNPKVSYDYDSYGNLISETDPNGYKTEYGYDSDHTFVTKVKNAKGHVFNYTYDPSGNLLSETDTNGYKTEYTYDGFGRITKEILPYDTKSYPTVYYTYEISGTAPETIRVNQRESGYGTYDSYYIYDGFGNLIQKKRKSDYGYTTTDYFYDKLGRLKAQSNPYFNSYARYRTPYSTVKKTEYVYDVLGRVTQVINPDSTKANSFYKYGQTVVYDENSHRKDYNEDAYGNMISVKEYNDGGIYTTKYSYDAAGNLVKIVDSQGNEIKYVYDSLGRKTKIEDPDLGIWSYDYDAAGNMIKQTDNKGNSVVMSYDEVGRMVKEESSEGTTTYSYDQGTIGMLSSIKTPHIIKNYKYDERLRVVEEEKIIDGTSFKTISSYDSADRIRSTTLPNGEKIEYGYKKGGSLNSVSGIISSTYYNEFGRAKTKNFANGLTAEMIYNSENSKLEGIKVSGKQELNYDYDNVGNIVKITDAVHNKVDEYEYDDLDRLTKATRTKDSAKEFEISYTYDSIGNMLKVLSNLYNMVFEYKVHAPVTLEMDKSCTSNDDCSYGTCNQGKCVCADTDDDSICDVSEYGDCVGQSSSNIPSGGNNECIYFEFDSYTGCHTKGYVDSGTVVSQKDCDNLDTTCRDYHDADNTCDGNGVLILGTCDSFTDMPTTTMCGTGSCPADYCEGNNLVDYPGYGHRYCDSGSCGSVTCTSSTTYSPSCDPNSGNDDPVNDDPGSVDDNNPDRDGDGDPNDTDCAPDDATIYSGNSDKTKDCVNENPVLNVHPLEITVDEGETIRIYASATDPDGDDVTINYYGYMTSPVHTTTHDEAGYHEVTVIANDGNGRQDLKVVKVTVNNIVNEHLDNTPVNKPDPQPQEPQQPEPVQEDPKPDLEFSTFTKKPDNPVVGGPVMLRFTIVNSGEAAANHIEWDIRRDDKIEIPQQQNTFNLGINEEMVVYTMVKYKADGVNNLVIKLDPQNKIEESNKENNVYHTQIYVMKTR